MKPKIHFMGIDGSGVSGVASLASRMGYKVTGCDLKKGGHDASHVKGVDLVIVSPAVLYQNPKHKEVLEAKKQGKLITWQEFLGKILLKNKKLICVAGTHGKSTTTAMAGKLLIDNGFDPIVVLGAFVEEWNGNSRFGNGEYAVVEADEFNNNFLYYNPEIAIITNIEFDHPDFFINESHVKASFKKFITRSDLVIDKINHFRRFNLKVFGEHNQKNANMVFVLGKKLGISDKEIIKSLEEFSGIGRRLELIGENDGVKIYDDYAHHPTAIKATLEALRGKYPNEKILAIIEPHGYKRTEALLPLYKNVFNAVDGVIIGPIFAARDKVIKDVSPQKIVEISNHQNIQANSKFDIKNYNVVVVMGAGNSNLWAKQLLNN